MLRQRVMSALILLPIVIALTYLGGWAFNAMVLLVIGVAAWEYGRIFHDGGYAPSSPLLIGGSLLLVLFRALFQFQYNDALISGLVLLAMTWHIVSYERGAQKSASDFAITLSGIFYIGWLGAYFVSLRMLNLASGGFCWPCLRSGWPTVALLQSDGGLDGIKLPPASAPKNPGKAIWPELLPEWLAPVCWPCCGIHQTRTQPWRAAYCLAWLSV